MTDSFGRPRYYSFEACTTPPRNQCSNYGLNNYGDGDFQYCQGSSGSSGSSGSWGSSGSSGSGSWGSSGSSGSWGSSGSSGSWGSSGSGSWNRPNRPNRPNGNYGSSLQDILNGNIRTGSNSGNTSKKTHYF